jgi:hypothetical protein
MHEYDKQKAMLFLRKIALLALTTAADLEDSNKDLTADLAEAHSVIEQHLDEIKALVLWTDG